MNSHRFVRAIFSGVISGAIVTGGACASPSTPMNEGAILAIEGLTATVEPITTPGSGWLYRFTYRARETSGSSGATLTATHFALSNGFTADGDFFGLGVLQPPRVPAAGTIPVESNLSLLTTAAAASHVAFTVKYTDDAGHSGSASASADISPVTP